MSGSVISKLKESCNCNIVIGEIRDKKSLKTKRKAPRRKRDEYYGEGHLKLCTVEGTRANIEKCLDQIKDR